MVLWEEEEEGQEVQEEEEQQWRAERKWPSGAEKNKKRERAGETC